MRAASVVHASIVLLAATFSSGAADKPVIQDVWAPPDGGKYIQRNGVRWNETYDESGYPKTCVAQDYTDYCLPGRLLVRNESAAPIVCHGEIQMPRGNRLSLAGATRDMIVMELDSAVLVKTMTAVNIQAKSHSSDCKPWQPPPPPVSGPGCAYLPVADQIELDYPPGAKEREEEGPVVLHFTLAQKSGRPGKIEVAGSSLFAELDAAAVRTLAATDMTTECPGARFSVLLNYRLDHQIAPPSPAPFNRSMTGEPCKAQLVRPVNPDDFYPKGSIERGEQGAPIVAVHVAEKAGPPLDVRLDGSSGFPELDAAGLLAIRNSRFSANCPGQWLRLKVKFVLKTPEPAPPGPSGS